MNSNDILNGLAMTGVPAPVLLLGNDRHNEASYKDVAILGADEPGYSAGNIGLNYLYPKPVQSPVDFVYNGNDAELIDTVDESESGFSLFPCLKECKGLGAERKKCLADCRGKLKPGQRKTVEVQTDAKIAAAMEELAKQESAPAKSNAMLWIVLSVVVLVIVIGIVVYLRLLNKHS